MEKIIKISVLIVLLIPAVVNAQVDSESGLILRGHVNATSYADTDRKMLIKWLTMEFENKGTKPLIIINPSFPGNGTGLSKVTFQYLAFDRARRKLIDVGEREQKFRPAKSWSNVVPMFDDNKPPENLTVILKPGEKFSFQDSFKIAESDVSTCYSFTNDAVKKQSIPRYCTDVPGFMRLTYEFSFLPYLPNPNFLEELNSKWKRYGYLPVGINGTYKIVSERMLWGSINRF